MYRRAKSQMFLYKLSMTGRRTKKATYRGSFCSAQKSEVICGAGVLIFGGTALQGARIYIRKVKEILATFKIPIKRIEQFAKLLVLRIPVTKC